MMAKHLCRGLRSLLLISMLGGMTGCATSALDLAPADSKSPYRAAAAGAKAEPAGGRDFAVAPDPSLPVETGQASIDSAHAYTLPELIDVAQSNNPLTKAAWERTRQAALAVGVAKATYLPILSADILAGYERSSHVAAGLDVGPIDVPPGTIVTTGTQFVPSATVKWLLFDFGGREAARNAAQQLSFAANVTFNGVHQKLIFDVSNAYYMLTAARTQLGIARQTLTNAKNILGAAEARRARGIGTTIEVAHAKQQVAQAEFDLTLSVGHERSAYQAVLGAMGVSPTAAIKVTDASRRPLPRAVPENLDKLILASLQRRPDIQAAFARVKADQQGIAAAKADFLPKVALIGSLNRQYGRYTVDDSRLPGSAGLDVNHPNASVLLGVTMPIYDGGLKAAKLKAAESQVAASREELLQLENVAAREIVTAYDLLRTNLASHTAATSLVNAANVTYQATLDYYKNGLGTIVEVNAAHTGLLQARLAQATAHSNALIAAATMAFASGTLTNRLSP